MVDLRVGTKRVIFSETLLVPDGESVSFAVPMPDAPALPMVVRFESKEEGEHNRISWEFKDGVLTFKFGRQTGIGSSTPKISRIGDMNGKEISFGAFYHRTETMGHIQFQVLLEV
jgi:hypothetical protein